MQGLYLQYELPVPDLYGASPVMDNVMKKRLAAGFANINRIIINVVLWSWAVAVPLSSLWSYGLSAKFVLFGLYPFVVSSMLFMSVTQVSHIQRETQTRRALDCPDFFKRQAMTSLDYSCESPLWGFLTGGLNTQSIHHVLPVVHSSHYSDLYPKFREVCLRHGCAPPQEANFANAFLEHLRYVYSLGELYTPPKPEM